MAGILDTDVKGQQAYSWAIAEKLSYWCATYSGGACTGASDNAMLNYLATRGSAWLRYDVYITGKKPIPPGPQENWNLAIAKSVVLDALSSVTPYGSLADFGNQVMFPEQNWTMMVSATIGYDPDNVVWRSLDFLAYVMTAAQISYWRIAR